MENCKTCFFISIILMLLLNSCTPYSAEVQFDEKYLCAGPDENGEPLDIDETFSGKDLKKIYFCGYVQTSEPILLSAYWIPRDETTAFVWNPGIEIEQSGYIYFSLIDAIQYTDKLPFGNYYKEYTDEGFIPLGEYQVVIEQARKTITTIEFTVE